MTRSGRPALAVLAAALLAPGSVLAGQGGPPAPTTPIEHFIVLMQENHSFDNYFGTYPGADGIPEGTCMPWDPANASEGCVESFHVGGRAIVDLHDRPETHVAQYRNGRMDGFVAAFAERGPIAATTMGYYDDRDLPLYWNIADQFVLFDRFFSSAAGGSLPNHMFWVTGTPGSNAGERIPGEGSGDLPTIFDRLEEKGISWKFYVQNYDGRTNLTARDDVLGDRAARLVRVPLLGYTRYLDDPNLSSKIVDLNELLDDLGNGTLPAVAYIVPSGAGEHPPGTVEAGERLVRTLLNALMSSEAWPSSAFVWTYDDWGGWYDHVPPPQVDEDGYGFRVPALLVSAHARRGHVDSTVLDYTSILKFIEENWRLEPLAERDRRANNFLSAFDFSSPPRDPVLLSRERVVETPARLRARGVIYASYAAALAIPLLLGAWATLATRVRRRAGAVFGSESQ